MRCGLVEAIEYRAQTLLGLVTAIVPLLMMSVWLAIVDQTGPASGWQREDFIAYYVAVAMVYQFTMSYAVWEWEREIRNGDFSSRLLKPLHPFHFYFSLRLGSKVFDVLIIGSIVVVATLLIPALHYPLSPERLAAFALSVVMGYMLNTLISTSFGLISFWTTQSGNIFSLWYGVGQFLSGWLAPLALFPTWFAAIAIVLPFHSTLGFPVEILTGLAGPDEIAVGFAISAGWIALFALIFTLLWRRGVARYEAVGS